MTLVLEYAQGNSEQAFATLVSRHVNLVYSVARRQVGDPHLAEEVTQSVFIILAGKAKSLSPKTILSGWLCRTARYVSANTLSIQRRRQFREQEAHMQSILNEPEPAAWNQIAPMLDEALNCLAEKEHDAVVLRFFDGKELKQVGAAMGIGEDAARMRVNRALEKLRQFFAKRGVTLSATAIAGAVAANSVQAAPIGLAAAIITAAFSGTAITTTAAIAATKAIAMTTLHKTVITAAFAIVAGAGIYEASQVSRLRDANQNLTTKLEESSNTHNIALSAPTATQDELQSSRENHAELLRLRGEVGVLRRQTEELKKLREESRQLPSSIPLTSGLRPHSQEMTLTSGLRPHSQNLGFFPGQVVSEWARVKINDSGEIFVNKKLVTLAEFATECERLKQVGGAAKIYVDVPNGRAPNPAQTNALGKLVDAGVPMKAEPKESDLEDDDP
jgi:RNA polymerase sigma factor (sigma-70 family)